MDRRLTTAAGVVALVITVLGIVACQRPGESASDPPLIGGLPQDRALSCMPVVSAPQQLSEKQTSSGARKDGSGKHFAVGSLDSHAWLDRFRRKWYSCHLAALQEPPLYNVTVDGDAAIKTDTHRQKCVHVIGAGEWIWTSGERPR